MAVSHCPAAGFIRSNYITHVSKYTFQTNFFTEMAMNVLRVLSASQDGCAQVHLYLQEISDYLCVSDICRSFSSSEVDNNKFQEIERSEIS